jgi:predicted nuclease of predicted toxin-antitoxin system
VPFRLLADENVATGTAAELTDRGHDALHVMTAPELGAGTPDPEVAAFARRTDRVLITGDTGFLEPDHRDGATVLFCQDDDLRPEEVGALVDLLPVRVESIAHVRERGQGTRLAGSVPGATTRFRSVYPGRR